MQNITIGRFDKDPQAQGCISPADDSWQLVLDKDGIPHLYVRCKLEQESPEDPDSGLLCIEDLLPPDCTIRDLMQGSFGGKLPPEERQAAYEEFLASKAKTGIPCPREITGARRIELP